MKKVGLITFFLLMFTGCLQPTPEVSWGKSLYFEFEVAGQEEGTKQLYFFQYPEKANVSAQNGEGVIVYEGCEVNFSRTGGGENDFLETYKRNERKVENMGYESWYNGEKMIFYSLYLENFGYYFWSYDDGGVLACKDLIEQIATTFTDKPLYVNERFGFSFEILMDYKLEQLPSNEGVVQKKWFEEDSYAVQISVYGEENVLEYQDALALYRDKYEGFDSDFDEVDGKTAVYVNEGQGNDALRHMIIMSEDGSTIYRAELRVPSVYFGRHQEDFDEFTKKIRAD